MLRMLIRFFGSAILMFFASATMLHAGSYFVSGNGLDTRDGSTETLAFRNLSKAAGVVNPGDTVWILTGTYSPFTITRSGSAQASIVWKKKLGATPEIKSNAWDAINIAASYQVIDGLTITGNNGNVTLAAAEADYDAAGSGNGSINGNGISIDGRNVITKYHHITIRNCIVRKCGGGGINAMASDHVIIEDNQVYENAWYSRYGCSGISILSSANVDQDTGYHMIVQRNRVWNNRGLVKWKQIDKYSDGNGIIVDSDKDHNFTGKTLVCNNVSFNNGGSGIHSFKSQNVDIFNNTTYYNGLKVGYASCFAGSSTNVRIFNNIMYAAPNLPPNSNWGNTNVTYDYNIYYGGTAAVVPGAHSLTSNPGFINLSTNSDVADFRLISTSNAKNAGTTVSEVTKDILGVARPQGSAYDIGAYEYVATTGSISIPQLKAPAQNPKQLISISNVNRSTNTLGAIVNARGCRINAAATPRTASGIFFHQDLQKAE